MNGLQGELLKYGGKRVQEKMFNYISKCWDAAEVPSQCKDAKVVAIYKRKGDRLNVEIVKKSRLYPFEGKSMHPRYF